MALNWLLHKKTNLIVQAERIKPTMGLLIDIDTNILAQVVGFAPSLSSDRRTQLQAYGIIPGNTLQIRQKKPVTIIQVEHTELAIETDLAKLIYVEIN